MKYLWETNKELINQLQRESKLFHSTIHGFKHWRRVEKNGLYLSQFNDGDPAVISHFAYFHDCMRFNEHKDDGHGLRGGRYALKNKDILDLNKDQLNTLYKACAGHTGGINPSCDTIACCWDADRLDLRRVGIRLDLKWINTTIAKQIVTNGDFYLMDN